ncbi:protein MMS22-like [Condylostylus longicornis]|uniref:protein MMS22-like n=1 Tax=Condylostylus longicornis TaxID=2530218 RepID=UPI00244E0659|nr:protein MMS22-like [Condylostylus longicornis]
MDFDLFETEDDDMLSSMNIAQTEQLEFPTNSLPEFNCQGEDTTSLDFLPDSFAKNFRVFNINFEQNEEIQLTKYNFDKNSLYSSFKVNLIFGQIRMNIQKLIVNIKSSLQDDNLTFYQNRRQVTLLFHLINGYPTLDYMKLKPFLDSIRNLLDESSRKDFFRSIYLAYGCKGNETDSPAYHLLHGFLEWRLLDLSILVKHHYNLNSDLVGDEAKEKFSFVLNRISRVLDDLIQISIYFFKKKTLPDSLYQSNFQCTCIKESWLILQFIIESLKNDEFSFWKLFNERIDEIKLNTDHFDISSEKIPEFTLWLLKGLVRLQGYKTNGVYDGPSHSRVVENFDLLEPVVEQFLNLNPSEEQTRIFLCNLMPILLEWWSPKPNISMILWEYFHKKLNSQFFIAGSAPSNLAISSSSGKGYLEKIKTLLVNCKPDPNLSSYILFTLILGKTIEKLIKTNQNNQVQKIFGRIYTKFSPAKYLALSEIGIHHLIELFLTLTLSSDIQEIAPKIKDKLLLIQLDKISLNRQICIMKGHVALMILYVENFMDLSDYIKKILEQLNSIKNDINICKILSEGLCEILKKSENFDNGEYLLVDSWITHYLNNSLPVEQERTLEAIHNVFEKIQNYQQSVHFDRPSSSQSSNNVNPLRANNFQSLKKNFNLHLFPFIKQNFSISFSIWIPKLAADFCIHCHHNNSSMQTSVVASTSTNINISDQAIFQKNFQFFIDATCSNKEAPLKFLLSLLASDKRNVIPAATIIQVWLKSLVLLSSNNEDVVNLTRIVTNLDEFGFVCDLAENDLLTAKETLCVFVSAVGRNYRNIENFQTKCSVSDKFNKYLNGFEKWYTDKNEKPEVTIRFYSFIAIVIFNCPEIVYAKSKITCFFHIAMTRFILPTTIQVGKAPDQKLTQVIHKVWPVLVQGIGNLNFKGDPYVSKTLTDLIVKWTPYFKISQNPKIVARPFLNCLSAENEQLSIFVFEKLTTVFLTMQRRQADPNACLVITIFQEIVEANSDNSSKLKLFVKATCLTTLEHLMMVEEIVPSRSLLLDMFKKICRSSAFRSSLEIREIITEHLRIITVKHLSYYTFFLFDMLTQIVNICVDLVEPILGFLMEQIKVVEQKRGVGEDQRIRSCFQKLQGSILAAKNRR